VQPGLPGKDGIMFRHDFPAGANSVDRRGARPGGWARTHPRPWVARLVAGGSDCSAWGCTALATTSTSASTVMATGGHRLHHGRRTLHRRRHGVGAVL